MTSTLSAPESRGAGPRPIWEDMIDIFTIWATVIIAIGFQVLGKPPRAQAYLAAALVWLCCSLPTLLGAIRAG